MNNQRLAYERKLVFLWDSVYMFGCQLHADTTVKSCILVALDIKQLVLLMETQQWTSICDCVLH